MSLFEKVLEVSKEEIEIHFRDQTFIPWADYWLNPRRLRGSDFLMRWSQGQWSEERILQAVNETDLFFAIPYGPSGTAPDNDVREFELYFERLEAAGLGKVKRPDLLIFSRSERGSVQEKIEELGGIEELPFTPEEDPRMEHLLEQAIIAVECENSLWVARQMPEYGVTLTPQKRLSGLPGVKKSAVLPTVIMKDEDRSYLKGWQTQRKVPIHIWHVFYDLAFGLALNDAEGLIQSGKVEPTEQVFQAPGGATTKKALYKFLYHYAYPLGETEGEIELIAASITDKNGHILPYVRFRGGQLKLNREALEVLRSLSEKR